MPGLPFQHARPAITAATAVLSTALGFRRESVAQPEVIAALLAALQVDDTPFLFALQEEVRPLFFFKKKDSLRKTR